MTKTQEKGILATQKSVSSNALKLYDRITTMINAFINKDILSRDLEEDASQDKKKTEYEESIAERTKRRRQN